MNTSNFHLSLPCQDIVATKAFYINELGFLCGREAHNWIDISLFGNQITFAEDSKSKIVTRFYSLDDKRLPLFHIGVILDRKEWEAQLKKHWAKPYLEIEPTAFLGDKVGEHESFFVKDPNGYYLEFKTFNKPQEIFNQ